MVNNPSGVEATHLRIAELVQSLHGRSDTDSDTVIAELAEHAAVEIPGAQYAGITVTRNGKHIETPAATHMYPMLLDKIQQRHQEGPASPRHGKKRPSMSPISRPTTVSRSTGRTRWPRRRSGSIMAFQLFIAGETMGALNVYAETPNVFDGESRNIGLVFAAHSSVAWNSARRDEQFKHALASRDVIGQAKGMIMERYGVDAVQAFELLRKLSQDSNVPLIKVATELVADTQSAAK